MQSLLLFTLFTLGLVVTVRGSSYSCSTDCINRDSLYEKLCCNSSNRGQSFIFNESQEATIVLCSNELPSSCEKKHNTVTQHTDCAEWYAAGYTDSSVYLINPDGQDPFEVYCDMDTDGGGWTVFQRREDGTVNFYRNWDEYKEGFGDLNGEFWLGLSKLHRLTNQANKSKLRVDLEDFDNNTRFAKYSTFSIGNSSTDYVINSQGYSGNAGDSLLDLRDAPNAPNFKFTTMDRDNDNGVDFNCAVTFKGAWWYNHCHRANLNGLYLYGSHSTYADGVEWYDFTGHYYSLKFSEMKVKVAKI